MEGGGEYKEKVQGHVGMGMEIPCTLICRGSVTMNTVKKMLAISYSPVPAYSAGSVDYDRAQKQKSLQPQCLPGLKLRLAADGPRR